MRTVASAINKKFKVLAQVEIEGGTLRSAVQAVMGRLMFEMDKNADLTWDRVVITVERELHGSDDE